MVKTMKKSTRKPKGGARRTAAGGDIPARAKHTYTTTSCAVPRVTDTCTVRALTVGAIAATATSTNATSLNFSLSGSSLSAGQWDQYRLLAVRFTITPDQNSVGLFTNSTTSWPQLFCVIDYDDATNLTTVVQAEAYNNCIVLGAGESCERMFKPRMALSAYTGAFGGFANVADQWIDAASTGVQHYGIKIIVNGAAAAQTQLPSWKLVTEYFFEFRKSI